jgi:AcrR family transcriptional regulator
MSQSSHPESAGDSRDLDAASSQRRRGPDRREELCRAARELFVAQGYAATTTRQVARAAGVSEAVLSRHFPGKKKELFQAVLLQVQQGILSRWQAVVAAHGDPQSQLTALMEALFAVSPDAGRDLRFLHWALIEAEAECGADLQSFFQNGQTLVSQILAEGQQAGVFHRGLDPHVGAGELLRSSIAYHLLLPLRLPDYLAQDHLPRLIECLLQWYLKTDV